MPLQIHNQMHKIIKLFIYYIFLLTGLILISWLIWSRFIRERTVRDIPDDSFNEFRFWILLYICIIYIIIIKNLLKTSKEIPGMSEFVNIIYKPLITLDHAIKYNKFIKSYYYNFMLKLVNVVEKSKINNNELEAIIFFIQIVPRIILVIFLFLDTFYFQKLEIFYKIVLIGLFPLIFRYFKYSCKDILEQWTLDLEAHYEHVRVFEINYDFDKHRIENEDPIFHKAKKTIREYIEIKYQNMFDFSKAEVTYQYESTPHYTKEYYKQYILETYKVTEIKMRTIADIDALRVLYYKLMPKILEIKLFNFQLQLCNERFLIKNTKVVIFGTYLICWGYILLRCYIHLPVDFLMFKYFMNNLMLYLYLNENPFAELYWGSLNENLITIEALKEKLELLKNTMKKIIEEIINKFKP
jgi:hypothetical protein